MESRLRSLNCALLFVAAFSFGISLLMLTVPIFTLQVYDRVLSSRSEMTLLMLALVAIGLVAACSLLDMVRTRLLTRIAASFENIVAPHAFAALVRSPDRGTGMPPRQPLDDVETVRNFIAGPALRCLFDLPWVPLWLGLLALLHPLIGAVAFAGAALLVVVGLAADIASRRPYARSHACASRARDLEEASLRSGEAVKAMGIVGNLEREWRQPHGMAMDERMSSSSTSGAIACVSRGLRQGLQVVVLAVGAYLAIGNAVTPGVIIAASLIMARGLAPIEGLSGQWRGVAAARGAWRRLRDLPEQQKNPHRSGPHGTSGNLRVENLILGMPGRHMPLLSGVSFAIPAGTVLGIVGRTGSGKSLLLAALVGLIRPRWGTVALDGADITQWEDNELGPLIGYVPEEAQLVDGTIAQNIARHGAIDIARVTAAARRAGVHEMLMALPEGYNTLVHDGGRNLSGGQRKAVALARAIYGDPVMVVLDEPTSNTDFAGDRALIRLVEDLKGAGVTVIVASRQGSLLACADKLLLIEDGRMEIFGDRDDLTQRFPRLQAAVGSRSIPAKDAA